MFNSEFISIDSTQIMQLLLKSTGTSNKLLHYNMLCMNVQSQASWFLDPSVRIQINSFEITISNNFDTALSRHHPLSISSLPIGEFYR